MDRALKRDTSSGRLSRRAAAFDGAVAAALLFMMVFILSYLTALGVTLPFSNPHGIVGTLTAIQFNPHTNIVRFLIITISPALSLVAAFFLFPRYLQSRLFRAPFDEMPAETFRPTRWRWVLVPLLVLTTLLVALDSASYMASGEFETFEEGQPLSAGMSYLSGGTPYRDFVFVHGLFDEPLRAAFAFTVFGPSIGGLRALQSIIKLITFGLLAWFLFRAFRGKPVYAFALLFAFHQWRPDGGHGVSRIWDIHPVIIVPRDMLLFAFLVALTYLFDRIRHDHGRPARLFWLAAVWSMMPVLAYIHSMERGIYLLVVFTVIAPFCYALFFRGGPRARPFILGCVAGVSSSLLLLTVLIDGAYAELGRFMALLASNDVQLQFGSPYPFNSPPYVAISMMMAFNCFWLAREFLIRCRHTEGLVPALREFLRVHLVEASLLLISLLFYKNALGRPDWIHVAYVLPPPVILFALILLRHVLPPFLQGAGVRIDARVRVAVVVAFWVLVTGWNVRLAASVLREGVVEQNFPLNVGDDHHLPERWRRLVPFLRSNLSSNESFYMLSDELSLYYFVGKTCPVRFPMLAMVVKNERYQREIIADVEARRVKYVVYDPSSYYYQIDGFSNEVRAPLVFEYVHAHYRRHREIDGQVILIRNDAEAP